MKKIAELAFAVLALVAINAVTALLYATIGQERTFWLAVPVMIGGIAVVYRQQRRTNRVITVASPDARAAALKFTPDSGKAGLYVVRSQVLAGLLYRVSIEVEGKLVAQLKTGFVHLPLAPGPHRVVVYFGPPAPVKMIEATFEGSLEDGELLLLVATMRLRPYLPPVMTLARVELDKVRDAFRDLPMVAVEPREDGL